MATRTTRTRIAPPKPKPAETNGEAILAITTSKPTAKQVERRVLFTIDDEEFDVPAVIDPPLVYLGLDRIRTEGAVFAAMYLMELILGAPQYARLVELYGERKITEENFGQVSNLVKDLFMNTANNRDGEVDQDAAGKASDDSQDG